MIHVPVEFHLKSREVYEFMDSELEENFDEEIVTLQYDEKKKAGLSKVKKMTMSRRIMIIWQAKM